MGSCQSSAPSVDARKRKRTTKESSLRIETFQECAIDDSTVTFNTRERIKRWKEELEASGNLTKTVVNIEVSIVAILFLHV